MQNDENLVMPWSVERLEITNPRKRRNLIIVLASGIWSRIFCIARKYFKPEVFKMADSSPDPDPGSRTSTVLYDAENKKEEKY